MRYILQIDHENLGQEAKKQTGSEQSTDDKSHLITNHKEASDELTTNHSNLQKPKYPKVEQGGNSISDSHSASNWIEKKIKNRKPPFLNNKLLTFFLPVSFLFYRIHETSNYFSWPIKLRYGLRPIQFVPFPSLILQTLHLVPPLYTSSK